MELHGWIEQDASDLDALDIQANGRSFRLLINNLSSAQRHQFDQHNFFDGVESKSGARYRIRHGHMMNVERFDENGQRLVKLCFAPRGRLLVGDIMLAQKLALELFEPDAIKVPLWDDPHEPW